MSAGRTLPRFNAATLSRLALELDLGRLWFHARYELGRRATARRWDPSKILPSALYLETSSFCRGECHGCYVPVTDRRQQLHLSDATLAQLLAETEGLGLDYVCLVGGEPLDASIVDTNLRLVSDHPRQRFLICTGASGVISASLMARIGRLRNLSLIFSFDGLQQTHDRIRWAGSFERTLRALERYQSTGGQLAGASITVRSDNWGEVASREFLDELCERGCSYFVFDACESDAPGLAPTAAQYAEVVGRLRRIAVEVPAQVFANPIGQVLGARLRPTRRMFTLAVDFYGDVYTSRRGRSFGNINGASLASLLLRPDLQASYRSLPGDAPLPAPGLDNRGS